MEADNKVRRSHSTSLFPTALGCLFYAAVGGELALLGGCETGPTGAASRQFTSTVAVGSKNQLQIDSLISLSILGERRDDAIFMVDATVTASSSDKASEIIEAYDLTVDLQADPSIAFVTAGPPGQDAFISGLINVRAPRDMDLRILLRGGTLSVGQMEGDVLVDSLGSVSVFDADNDVVLRIESGNALVDSALRAGTRLDINVASGSIQINLPLALSANIQASASGGVVSTHPSLPSRPGTVPYRQTAGTGASSIVATTTNGTVFFAVR